MSADGFEFFVKRQGPVTDLQIVPAELADSYAGRLPSALREFWKLNGWGSYSKGLLKLCDPAMLSGVLQIALEKDRDFGAGRCTAYAYTAFGEVFAWHQDHQNVRIDFLEQELSCEYFLKPEKKVAESIAITSMLATFDFELYDVDDTAGRPLYQRAVHSLGSPKLGECFGFFPALGIGGVAQLENLKRVNAAEHFAILAQIAPLRLMDTRQFRISSIREIG